jgi:hypothetical protein
MVGAIFFTSAYRHHTREYRDNVRRKGDVSPSRNGIQKTGWVRVWPTARDKAAGPAVQLEILIYSFCDFL